MKLYLGGIHVKKKFLLLLTMVCFIFSFTACTAEEEPVEEQNQPIEEQQQVDPGNDGDIDDNNLENDVIEEGENIGDEMNNDMEEAGQDADDAMQEAGQDADDAATDDNIN